jgi:hypothetical protein
VEPLIKSPQDIVNSIKAGQGDPRVTSEEKFKQDMGEHDIPVRLLTVKEKMDIVAQSREWFLTLPELQREPVLLIKKQAILTLLAALRSSDDSPKDAHKYFMEEATLEKLDEVTFVQLFNEYNDIVQRYDLSLDNLSDSECAELHDHIKKNRQLVKELSRSQLEQAYLNLLDLATELKDSLSGVTLQKITTMNS